MSVFKKPDTMSLPVSMVSCENKDKCNFKMNERKSVSTVMKRHQSLPSVLRCNKNCEGPVTKSPLTPQKMTSQNNYSVVKIVPKFRESLSPAREPMARVTSPPSPKKFLKNKENSKKLLINQSDKPERKTCTKPVNKTGSRKENQTGNKSHNTASAESQNQPKLTSFFPIRRSERRPKFESEALQQKLIDDRLLADHDQDLGLEIKLIPEKGRGVFTMRNVLKGEFVVEYSGDLIDVKQAKEREGEYSMDLSKGCYMYYFKANNKQYCIDATKETGRLGRLVNHSRIIPNLQTRVIMFKGIPRLILIAKRDVNAGEELLYDYGDRSKQSLEAHPWLAL